jgi:hypothetical protein
LVSPVGHNGWQTNTKAKWLVEKADGDWAQRQQAYAPTLTSLSLVSHDAIHVRLFLFGVLISSSV